MTQQENVRARLDAEIKHCEEAVDRVEEDALNHYATSQALDELGMDVPFADLIKRAQEIKDYMTAMRRASK